MPAVLIQLLVLTALISIIVTVAVRTLMAYRQQQFNQRQMSGYERLGRETARHDLLYPDCTNHGPHDHDDY